jgi:hypothetical protein
MRLSITSIFAAWLFAQAGIAVAGDLPDAKLTPGEASPVLTQEKICAKGFSTKQFRSVPASLKAKVYAAYGMRNHKGACKGKEGCEVDHLISLEIGGANTLANLWPQPYAGTPLNAHIKDKLENRLHKLVCAGTLTLQEAQNEIAGDWIASYKRRFGAIVGGKDGRSKNGSR